MNITDREKKQLRDKISLSVSSYVKRKRFLKYGIGFAVASLVGFFVVVNFQQGSKEILPLDSYVKTLDDQSDSDHIQLILGNEKNVRIVEKDAAISYSKTGKEITIGNSQSVSQHQLNEQKLVFNTLIVPYGKRSSIILADGSKVWLNSGSKLVFPAAFTQDKREVYLEGEGIFDVAHDKAHPFVVTSGNQNIEVLGTVFNVSNYSEDETISTVLKSGSIKLGPNNSGSTNSTENIVIKPNTLVVFDKNELTTSTKNVAVEQYFSWRDGIFIFKNDSLQSIMKKLSRYYDIEIIINDRKLANTTFSGSLDVNETIENVIKMIQETTKFEYTLMNNRLIIN